MHSLAKLMAERIVTGLRRQSITTASKWAESYREMPKGRWTFKRYPWLRKMHDSNSILNVGQKAAQMGFTETLLNVSLFTIDVKGQSVLYVLPNKKPDASKFSSSRFDPALELSPHLKNLFSQVDNVDQKRAGSASLYVVGSQSRSGLKSVPVSVIMMDEVAEFFEENIPLAMARVDGQDDKTIWMVSTPTVEGFGISPYFARTNKQLFFFKCPSCSQQIELKFPESLIITADDPLDPRINDSYLICYKCKQKLPHEAKPDFLSTGEWQETESNRDASGFSISQLYSTTQPPGILATKYLNSLNNEAEELEFHNSNLGVTHETEGARVSFEDINNAIVSGPKHQNGKFDTSNQIVLMGVDVGKYFHYELVVVKFNKNINYLDINNSAKLIVVEFGKVKNIADIHDLMDKYNVASCVMDHNPERRVALSFARAYPGRVKLCTFSRGANGRSVTQSKAEGMEAEPAINVDRTSWLDQALSRFRMGTIFLPVDANLEYKNQVRVPVKLIKKDDRGNPVASYQAKENEDDHYAFARTYSEIALSQVAEMMGANQDIIG